jgi:serine phosphatase RsbU (regulator of sigma subunit)
MGPRYGYRRFRDALRKALGGSVQDVAGAVFSDVDRHTRGRELDDDAVLVVVEIPREGEVQDAWRTPPPSFSARRS